MLSFSRGGAGLDQRRPGVVQMSLDVRGGLEVGAHGAGQVAGLVDDHSGAGVGGVVPGCSCGRGQERVDVLHPPGERTLNSGGVMR